MADKQYKAIRDSIIKLTTKVGKAAELGLFVVALVFPWAGLLDIATYAMSGIAVIKLMRMEQTP